MSIRWTGKRSLTGGYLDVGRFRLAYRGWRRPISRRKPIKIGTARLYSFGPIAVIENPPKPRTIIDAIHEVD